MKKENNIRVEMVRMEGDAAPFVEVGYVDKNAEEHTGLLMLDSCSMGNILCPEMADHGEVVIHRGKPRVERREGDQVRYPAQ